jgi:hypothetical protein
MKEIVIKLTAKKLRGSLDFARTQILRCFTDVSALTRPFVESYILLHKYKRKVRSQLAGSKPTKAKQTRDYYNK